MKFAHDNESGIYLAAKVNFNGYEIVHFRPELTDGVLQVLSYLWGESAEENLAYFQWKYVDNPYTENALGIIALHKNQVVGFRGYFATRWKITQSSREMIILCPGDTCVHPDHRRMNLSFAMGQTAMEDYAQKYSIFLNFSSNKNSVPGYLKMGFSPLINKKYMNQYTFPGMIRFILSFQKNKESKELSLPFGDYGDIEVSDQPKPQDMAAVISGQEILGKKIQLIQDEAFFRWRFHNKRKKYVFYYFRKNHKITGYAVIRGIPKNGRGFIIDYSAEDTATLEKTISFPIKNRHFNVMSIITYSVEDKMTPLLMRLKFKRNSVLGMLGKKVQGEWPLFVRPVKRNLSDKDFFIDGLDIRGIDSWSLKEICSDGA